MNDVVDITHFLINQNNLNIIYGKKIANSMVELANSEWFQKYILFIDDHAYIPKNKLIAYYKEMINLYQDHLVTKIFLLKINDLTD